MRNIINLLRCILYVRGVDVISEIFFIEYLIHGSIRRVLPKKSSRPVLLRKNITVKIISRCNSIYYCPKGTSLVFDVLPIHENGTMEFLKKYILNEGDIFIDIGAHVGLYTIPAAKIVGQKGKVIAIEPVSHEELRINVLLNGLKNVEIINKAVYSKCGVIGFVMKEARALSHIDERVDSKVEAVTLDEVVEKHRIDKIKCIKIDVEGEELEVIKGGEESLGKTNYVIVEVRELTEEPVKRLMAKKGFQLVFLEVLNNSTKNFVFRRG